MVADECQSTASSYRFIVSDETMREMIDLSILSTTPVRNTCIVISLKTVLDSSSFSRRLFTASSLFRVIFYRGTFETLDPPPGNIKANTHTHVHTQTYTHTNRYTLFICEKYIPIQYIYKISYLNLKKERNTD